MPDNELPPLRESLSAAFDKIEADNASEARDPAPVERQADEGTGADEAAQRARDEAGRFKSADAKEAGKPDATGKPREKLTLKGKPDAAKEQERAPADNKSGDLVVVPAAGVAKPDQQQAAGDGTSGNAQQPVIQPPQHWAGDIKIDWHKLPAPVREAIAKDHSAVSALRDVQPAIQHFAPQIMQRFGNIGNGLGSILTTWQQFHTNPLDTIRALMQQSGIHPHQLAGAYTGEQPPGQETTPQYVTQQDLAAMLERREQQLRAQSLDHQINSEVTNFATATATDGSLKYPFFNDLRMHMAGLFQSGVVKTMDEAYDAALHANPATRQRIAAMEQEKQAADRRRTALGARSAAVSVTGSPGVTRPAVTQGKTSVAESLSRAYDAVAGGSRA